MHPTMERIAVGGTPDVRVILYRNVPVMAMVRLPTIASEGRANLHQGAAAAAVHLVTGRTFGGVCNNRTIARHPDTGELIAGLEIPGWHDLLAAAMKLSDAIEMGYIGVDFVVDAKIGPVVLEANARPGLAIQVAHRIGLLPRLAAHRFAAARSHSSANAAGTSCRAWPATTCRRRRNAGALSVESDSSGRARVEADARELDCLRCVSLVSATVRAPARVRPGFVANVRAASRAT